LALATIRNVLLRIDAFRVSATEVDPLVSRTGYPRPDDRSSAPPICDRSTEEGRAVNAVAIANNDIAIIAWDAPQPIDNCLGFAVYRIDLGSGQATPLESWIGFQGQSNADWKAQSTEVWPVQEFQWKDLEARRGGSYRYRIVPMI